MPEPTPTLAANDDHRAHTFHDRAYNEAVTEVVAHLHSLADRIDREARDTRTASIGGVPRYAEAAAAAVHALTWGVANLSVGRLVKLAAQADATDPDQEGA